MSYEMLSVKLSRAQKRALRWLARQQGVKPSEWIRAAILQAVIATPGAPNSLLVGEWNTPLLSINGITSKG